jgi:hypothetical protein
MASFNFLQASISSMPGCPFFVDFMLSRYSSALTRASTALDSIQIVCKIF